MNKEKNLKPFSAPGSDEWLSEGEVEKRKRIYERLLGIGIDTAVVSEEEHENPYRIDAMLLINQDKEVPENLIKKIKQNDEEYSTKTKQKVLRK